MTRPTERHDLTIQFPTKEARKSFVSFMDHYGEQVYQEWMRGGGCWPDEVRFDFTQAMKKPRPNIPVTITATLIASDDDGQQ